METEIVESIARTLFVNAYASHCDECEGCELFGENEGHNVASHGADWMDTSPETPESFLHAAYRFVGKLEQANRMSLLSLLYLAAKADGSDPYADDYEFPEGYAEAFGSDLAMMHLGTGVSWFDDHAEFPLTVPYGETEIL